MYEKNTVTGADVNSNPDAPAINLEPMYKALHSALSTPSEQLQKFPLFSVEKNRLSINTCALVKDIYAVGAEKMREILKSFLINGQVDKAGVECTVGGTLAIKSEVNTSQAIHLLQDAIEASLEKAIEGRDIKDFLTPSLLGLLNKYTKTSGAWSLKDDLDHANLVQIGFASSERPQEERTHEVARVITAIEKIDGRNWLDIVIRGIEKLLKNNGVDDDDIEDITHYIKEQYTRKNSQIRDFLNFIEDEAMSRVRMHISMQLMASVALNAKGTKLNEYITRINDLFNYLTDDKVGGCLKIDLASAYGRVFDSELSDEMRKSTFTDCLPVWIEAKTQMFESLPQPNTGNPSIREVSYRFTVDGKIQTKNISVFQHRTEKIKTALHMLEAGIHHDPEFIRNEIAHLVFLSAVIPHSSQEPWDAEKYCEKIHNEIKENPLEALRNLHNQLIDSQRTMDEISSKLIKTLREHPGAIIRNSKNQTQKIYVSILDSIIDKSMLKDMSSSNENFMVSTKKENDNSEWLKHLRVDKNIRMSSLASIWVETTLQERSVIQLTDKPKAIPMKKIGTAPALAVRFIPYRFSVKTIDNEKNYFFDPQDVDVNKFISEAGVDVLYDVITMSAKKAFVKDEDTALTSQVNRAFCTTLHAAIIYGALYALALRIKKEYPQASMNILRLQNKGKDDKAIHGMDTSHEETGQRINSSHINSMDGTTAAYAICKAVEHLIGREMPCKVQGITLKENCWTDKNKFANTISAMFAGAPLEMDANLSLDKVALVTYCTRPATSRPDVPEATRYQFISKTYIAQNHNGKCIMEKDKNASRIVESLNDFATPHIILEEISRLRSMGFKHVMLLSHHYGNVHIGRASERHSPHTSSQFMDEAAKRFPDVHIYPLRRDILPVTRLRERITIDESAFEINDIQSNQIQYDPEQSKVRKSMFHIYTMATMNVVGKERKPQSAFCSYFFDDEVQQSNLMHAEIARANIMGIPGFEANRQSLISLLRGIHFMETEKFSEAKNPVLYPVLDPYSWVEPENLARAAEIEAFRRTRSKGKTNLCLISVLTHAMHVLHKEDHSKNQESQNELNEATQDE